MSSPPFPAAAPRARGATARSRRLGRSPAPAALVLGALLLPVLAACGSPQAPPRGGGSPSLAHAATPTASRCAHGAQVPAMARLASVDMLSADEGWIVGSLDLAGTCGLILHYSTGRWTAIDAPPSPGLNSVHMVSATEGWAVGQQGLILHYGNGAWTRQPSPVATSLASVDMLSPEEGWIAGAGTLLHYSGGQWQSVSIAAGIVLFSISMVSATDGWAVGLDQSAAPNAPTGIILRYDGSHWTPVHFAQPDPSFTYDLARVDMLSPAAGWIVGVAYNGAGDHHSVILRYAGGAWAPVPNPSIAGLSDIDMLSPADGWAVGDQILRYSNGAWSAVSSPASGVTLAGVKMLSPTEGWAVGAQGTILRFQNGSWTAYGT